ncbi:hypothetical protein [Sphingobacterium sp.]|uniref:hypothetical protein n=1 Tax=Sphingobacterium sp. TaxID=341027 RepID=UPI0031D78038
MRTIRIILIIAFLGMLFQSWGQTKEETIKWLTEKMMKENFFEEDHYTGTTPAKITRAIFDDNFVIINGVYSRDYKVGGRDYRIKENFKYGINLSKLSENDDKVEPEILDRFKKALKHYTTLMTSKKSNETF